ncbi:MAG TPA: TfoX/Sxy family protein [Solirubrobacteraceae bacterium]|nr:TfoX/Sxy family protein [Solirubrobacteraceae bacterium]
MAYDEELAERVRALLALDPDIVERRMFGGLAFLIGGHMSVCVSGGGGLLVRSEPAEADELLAQPHVEPLVMRGRPLSGWVRVAPPGVSHDAELRRWVRAGTGYARSLPPK